MKTKTASVVGWTGSVWGPPVFQNILMEPEGITAGGEAVVVVASPPPAPREPAIVAEDPQTVGFVFKLIFQLVFPTCFSNLLFSNLFSNLFPNYSPTYYSPIIFQLVFQAWFFFVRRHRATLSCEQTSCEYLNNRRWVFGSAKQLEGHGIVYLYPAEVMA